VLFGLGLFAAAFSSALSVALGASITCQSLLAQTSSTQTASTKQTDKNRPVTATESETTHNPVQYVDGEMHDVDVETEENTNVMSGTIHTTTTTATTSTIGVEGTQHHHNHAEFGKWADDGVYFRGIIFAIVLVGIVVGASGANTINVIITAQVILFIFGLVCVSTVLIAKKTLFFFSLSLYIYTCKGCKWTSSSHSCSMSPCVHE
jgi:hypothetical protein